MSRFPAFPHSAVKFEPRSVQATYFSNTSSLRRGAWHSLGELASVSSFARDLAKWQVQSEGRASTDAPLTRFNVTRHLPAVCSGVRATGCRPPEQSAHQLMWNAIALNGT